MNKIYYSINHDRCGRFFLDVYDRHYAPRGYLEHYIKRPGSVPFPTLELAHTFIANRQMEKLPCM